MPSQTNLDLAQRAVDLALKAGAAKADAVVLESSDTSTSLRLGKLESVERSESKDIGIRVFLDSKEGYKTAIISTNDLLDKNIKKTVDSAIGIAELAPADDSIGIANKSDLCKNFQDLELYQNNHNTKVEELNDWAKEAEDAALSVEGVTNSEGAQASFGESEFAFVTSNGFAHQYKTSGFSISASVIAGNGADMETDYDYSYVRNKSDLAIPKEVGKSAGTLAVSKLNPRKIRTQKLPVIYDTKISKSLLANLASSINAQAIVKESSFLTNYLNEQIFPKNINIIDNPLIKRGLSSQPFDAEGLEGKEMYLVENGILKNWILDLMTAKKLGLKSNARASRGIGSHTHPSSTNVYMGNGDKSFDELLSEISEGLYLTDLFGMGINTVNGNYSQGASGFWIKNGEIQYPVNEITVAGNLLDMFKNLEAADDLEMRYSKNAPTIRIESMMVAGS